MAGITQISRADQQRVAWRWERFRSKTATVAAFVLAMIGVVIMLTPFLWALLSSFKTEAEITRLPPTWLPEVWTLQSYEMAFGFGKMGVGIKNSIIVTAISVVGMVVGAALAGYAFARLRFPFRQTIFLAVLATMMIPWPVTLLPLYIMMVKFPLAGGNDILGAGGQGLINTFPGLILPHFAYPYGIYLMREFFKSLPEELEDAARIDGAGELRILFEIMVPLIKPAMAAMSILAFQFVWSGFIWPLVMTSTSDMNTIQLSLQQLQNIIGEWYVRYDVITAGGIIAVLPVLVVFLWGQRYFVRGIAMTGFK